jgi:hypothetical protein
MLVSVANSAFANEAASDIPSSSVGMPIELTEVVLPGSALVPAKVTDDTPVIIRIDAVYPHGTDRRYDFTVYGVEPGMYDIGDYLVREDGTATDDLPAIPFEVTSLLPAGQIEPHALEGGPLPWLWNYRWTVVVLAVVWMIGLYLIIGRRRSQRAVDAAAAAPPLSLADRLRPLVGDAIAGRLSPRQLAELERALVGYWRKRLKLGDQSLEATLRHLRSHKEAGPLIVQLEHWLHRPAGSFTVDVATILTPYQYIAAEELELADINAEEAWV